MSPGADPAAKPATKAIRLNRDGLDLMQQAADFEGVSLREYMEALMHYAISVQMRPGSWEGSSPFAFANYRREIPGQPDSGGFADRWFTQ